VVQEIVARIGRGETPSLEELISVFGNSVGLLYEYEKTAQDAFWHGEGTVYAHTESVLRELYRLIETVMLAPEKRICLVLAALFHDIAKPLTTREKMLDGTVRLVSPHHEMTGASYLAFRLIDQGISYPIVFGILQLVMCHAMPRRLVVDGVEKHGYYTLARQVDLELLYYLAKADALGRSCPDRDGQVELIDLFRLFVEDFGLWGKRDLYGNWAEVIRGELAGYRPEVIDYVMGRGIRDFERGLIYTPHEAIARSYAHLERFPELIVVCGISGSGKSTWAAQLEPEFEMVSQDNLRAKFLRDKGDQSKNAQVLNAANGRLRECLREKKKIVWDATNLRRDMRERVIRMGQEYNALVTQVVFHLSEDRIRARNASREHAVSKEVLDRQFQRFQWPEVTAAHRFLVLDGEGRVVRRVGYW